LNNILQARPQGLSKEGASPLGIRDDRASPLRSKGRNPHPRSNNPIIQNQNSLLANDQSGYKSNLSPLRNSLDPNNPNATNASLKIALGLDNNSYEI